MNRCCKYCFPPKRHLGCHSTCPEYLEEKKDLDRRNKLRQKKLKEENDVLEFLLDYKKKTINKRIKNYYR